MKPNIPQVERWTRRAALLMAIMSGAGHVTLAQNAPTQGASTRVAASSEWGPRLRDALPAEVANRVLATIAQAQHLGLPADALALRALKFAAKGVKPSDIERSVAEQAVRMQTAETALVLEGRRSTSGDEIEAGAEAIRRGVQGAQVSGLARSAPSGRSLVVPLQVVGGLIDRGVPAADALGRVLRRLQARAADSDFVKLASDASHDPSNPSGANQGDGRGNGKGIGNGSGVGNGVGNGAGSGIGHGGGPPAGVPQNGKKNGQGKRP